MEITHIISIVGALVAIIGVFFKREEILSLRHKDFTAKLDSTLRFFKEFYGRTDQRKLVLDRAAQEVVRLDFVDSKTIEYLIKLDENYLINIDETLNQYRIGRKFISYIPTVGDASEHNFQLKVPKNRSVKKQIFFNNAQYFIFAIMACIPFLFSSWFYEILTSKNTPFIYILFSIIFVVACLMAAVINLLEGSDLNNANNFINKIREADRDYQIFKLNEFEREKVIFKIPFTNLKLTR